MELDDFISNLEKISPTNAQDNQSKFIKASLWKEDEIMRFKKFLKIEESIYRNKKMLDIYFQDEQEQERVFSRQADSRNTLNLLKELKATSAKESFGIKKIGTGMDTKYHVVD